MKLLPTLISIFSGVLIGCVVVAMVYRVTLPEEQSLVASSQELAEIQVLSSLNPLGSPETRAELFDQIASAQVRIGSQSALELTADVSGHEVVGFQVIGQLAGQVPEDITLVAEDIEGLTVLKSEVATESGIPTFSYVAITKNPIIPFTASASTTLAKFQFTPQQVGELRIQFDQNKTKIIDKNTGENISAFPSEISYPINATPSATPIVTVTPTSTPTLIPTSTPTAIPTVTPLPTATPVPTVASTPSPVASVSATPTVTPVIDQAEIILQQAQRIEELEQRIARLESFFSVFQRFFRR